VKKNQKERKEMEYEKNFFHNLIKKTQVPEDCLIKENQSQKNEG